MKQFLSILLTLALMAALLVIPASAEENGMPSYDEVIVSSGEEWTVEENCIIGHLEIEDGGIVRSDHPVIVFYEESATVENGQVVGEVQFVSDYDEVVAIVHTNDVHGYIDVEPYVKGLKTQLEASGDYSLVLAVNAGDVYAGGYAAAHMYDGEFIPAIMDKVYDYMAWGNNDGGIADGYLRTYLLSILGSSEGMVSLVANAVAMHDIDMAAYAAEYVPTVGTDTLAALYPEALSLNLDGSLDWSGVDLAGYDLAEGEALPGTALVTTERGTVIGLFGETTNASPDESKDPDIRAAKGTLETAAECVNELQAAGADVIVEVCHTGWTGADSLEVSGNDTNSAQMALSVDGIDAIVDGHTHSTICDGEGWLFGESESATIVNQAHCWGDAIGVMKLYIKDGRCIARDCEVLTPEQYQSTVEPDTEVQAVVDACYARLLEDGYTTLLTETPCFLNGERLSSGNEAGGPRANETNLGDLVADGMLWAARQLREESVDVALYPGVRVRASIEAGPITMLDVLGVFSSPFTVYYQKYTAKQLVSYLNSSLRKVGQENEGFAQVSGLSLVYNSQKQVQSLTVGDELIYENGGYYVDDDWSVGCVINDGGGGASYEPEQLIFADNTAMAWAFGNFLQNGEYTIYPNEVAPAGRIVPCVDYEEIVAAGSGDPSGGAS